ncbi:MAG TPA: MFS transporter [Acidobacteriota bacterium]|nr:MFS transporter [Acidobacteriota bacterium]
MKQTSSSSDSTGLLRSFPTVFWVANVMELFERAAYYGLNSVLAIYLSNAVSEGGLGFSEQSVGFLQSLVYALTYIVPILGGALADRYGYRRVLLVAFSLLSAGYFASGHMSAYGPVFAALVVMATGSGLFKPIISGTIARTTTEENSGFGFGIYYWMINLGAFLAPLVVSYLKGFSWRWVFTASALYCALMLLPTIFLYRDPPRPPSSRRLGEVLGSAALVLGDARFMLMIFIYSGFWILYFQNFGSVLWFLRDFIDPTPVNQMMASVGIRFSFDAEHVTSINAGTIILLQVVVSRLVKSWKPLPTMITGMAIGAVGFLCLAFASSAWILILGIAVFSIGEMTAHPKYYSYVGLVAPADRKAVYMGYAFLYGVVGSLLGSNLGGWMYETMMKPLVGRNDISDGVRNFWLIFAALDVAAVAGLLLYNRVFAKETAAANRLARRIMLAIYLVLVLCGSYFLYSSSLRPEGIVFRTLVQSLIMLLIGLGGLIISFKPADGKR